MVIQMTIRIKPSIDEILNDKKEYEYEYAECPECGSTGLNVYLLADYNSTIDEFNKIGIAAWYYSDALTDYYCDSCDWEGGYPKFRKTRP
tara:strand:+ start:65 stop:334 length:270 start_codon:yes stop_codon:yes gene_type:complete